MKEKTWIKFYKDGLLDETITFAMAKERISLCIKKFQEMGINANDRVIVKMDNSVQTIITYLSLLELRAISIPINPKESKIKVDFIIKNCKPKFIIEMNWKITKLNKVEKDAYSKQYLSKIATIIYTSGTTGQPKGVCLSWKNWENNAKALIKHHNLNKNTVLATPLPLFHCNAHGLAMYATFLSKSQLILFDKTPKNFLDIINKEKVNVASIVPAILDKLYTENPEWRSHSKFQYFLTAAAPLRGDLLKIIMEKWNMKVVQGYGLTESTNFSCTMPIDIKKPLYKRVMFPNPSIGIEFPGVKIKINKNNNSTNGELIIKSNSNSLGYWGKPLAVKRVVKSGDIGYFKVFSNRRFYYLQGRIKELINRGGEKIYPLELEAEIRSLGINKEICVFSMPDRRLGEEVGLATTEKFNYSILKNIPGYRCPKKVYLLNSLFYTPTSKIRRSKVSQYSLANGKLVWEYEK